MQGRATLELKLTLAEARENGVKSGLIKIVADGYNAPVTAGGRASYSTMLAARHAVLSRQAAACGLCLVLTRGVSAGMLAAGYCEMYLLACPMWLMCWWSTHSLAGAAV